MPASAISVSAEQVSAHLSALAAALDALPAPAAMDDRQGGTEGLSHGMGHSVAAAASALRERLVELRTTARSGSDAMRESVAALVAADRLSEQDADAILAFIGEPAVAASPPPADGSTPTATSAGRF